MIKETALASNTSWAFLLCSIVYFVEGFITIYLEESRHMKKKQLVYWISLVVGMFLLFVGGG
ncbi:hypothetical protein, partial [Streptococcus sp. KR]|uniref:hypothetical protein n=1 Tax=Streptococcus sp. KR TaxID=1979528 RepID=UPI001C53371B